MKRTILAVIAVTAVAMPVPADAATATTPRVVPAGVLYYQDVISTVVVDGPAVITLTNLAYRHPEQTQATVVATVAGTYEIRDRCNPYVLPHAWRVKVDGVVVASASLKCR